MVSRAANPATAEIAKEVALLLDLAIRRTRGNVFAGEEVKGLVCRALEEGKRQILLTEERRDHIGPEVVDGEKGAAGMQEGGTSGRATSGVAGEARG